MTVPNASRPQGRTATSTLAGLCIALVLAACSHAPAPATPPAASTQATAWHDDVATIAAAPGDGRRTAIEGRLDALGLHWQGEAFTRDDASGQNVLAPVSGDAGAPLLLLGAHFDRVDEGQGATDNASGSAVVLALAERFRDRPLAHHRVAVAFWDLEERGLLGSHAHVEAAGEKPALYVNFDVFGWGDTLWMMTPQAGLPIATATRAAADDANMRLSAGEHYPPTDHLAFLKAGWPAVSYSLVGADEVDGILAMYAGRKPAHPPRVMEVIHSESDVVGMTDAAAAARGIDVVEAALRRWDAMATPSAAGAP